MTRGRWLATRTSHLWILDDRSIGGRSTTQKWIKEPEFQAAYREARRAAFGQSIARLQQGTSAAATTLLKTMIDPNTQASVKVRAAEAFSITQPRRSKSKTSKRVCRNWSGPGSIEAGAHSMNR